MFNSSRSQRRHWGIGLTIALAFTTQLTLAAIYDRQGQKLPDREVNSDRVNWQLLTTVTDKKYNGIGLIDLDYGVCTGFAIAVGNNPKSPAYVLTNAHCQVQDGNLPGAREIMVNRPSESNFILNYFHDFQGERLELPIKKIAYATMKNNDLAILELHKNQQELINYGIKLLQISTAPPKVGEPIAVVGIPSEGVKARLNFLHKSVCAIGNRVRLVESVYDWKNTIGHRCSIIGGMSGSPMISLKTDRVVGIVNTGVDDKSVKQGKCTLNRPCEIGKDGKRRTVPDRNYGQLIHHIHTCFNPQGIFNLYQPGCQLEKPL
jgi:V8-like Glu-specific endopeptidase